MANNILDRYGIKEVADVTFYELGADGVTRGNPILYLDTLKVSSIEQTAESVDARGGKGNPALVSWDFGKEISVTLEDALFSPKSMSMVFGNGLVNTTPTATEMNPNMSRTRYFICKTADTGFDCDNQPIMIGKRKYTLDPTVAGCEIKFYTSEGTLVATQATKSATGVTGLIAGTKYLMEYFVPVDTTTAGVITITDNSFPGVYYVVGDTYARSQATGEDEFFQFVIPKAKVSPESNTITLQADGDPTVFNLNLKVLRPDDGVMMKLIKYNLSGGVLPNSIADEAEVEVKDKWFE